MGKQWTLSLPYTLEAEQHMYDHAGFSVTAGETMEQGRKRSARELAQAEKWAQDNGFTFEWCDDWSIGDHAREFGECYTNGSPETCEECACYDRSGNALASLGGIDDATPEYRRVVQAELADQVYNRERANLDLLANSPELRALVEYAAARS